MKNFTLLFLSFFISFSALAQVTFNWETQSISSGNNLQEMNLVNDSTTFLVGYGRTFVKSADLGLTWDKVPVLTPTYDFINLSINSNGIGYACAGDQKVIDNPSDGEPDVYAHGLLLKTIDNGVSWSVTDISAVGTGDDPEFNPNGPGCYALHFYSVEVIDDVTAIIGVAWYQHEVSTGDRLSHSGVFKTVDDGVSWTSVIDNGRYPTAIELADSTIYFGGNTHLLKTVTASDVVTDIYPNLIAAAIPADSTLFVNDITIVNENEVYVTTSVDGIFKTVDWGATFVMLESGAPTGGNDTYKVNDSVLIVLGSSSKSKVSTDSCATWVSCYPGSTCYEIGGVFNDTLYGLGKSIWKIAVTDLINGTFNWVEQEINEGDNLHKMHIFNTDSALIIGHEETFKITDDGGVTWTEADLPELFVYGAEYDFSAVSTSDSTSYASTRRFKQFDFPSSSEYSDIYGHGLIYKSTDYWKTWDLLDIYDIGTGTDPSANPNMEGCYAVSPTEIECINDSIVLAYVTWNDTTTGADNKTSRSRVFKTIDSGDTWDTVTIDFGSRYVNSIYFINSDTGFIVGNTMLLKTNDGGDSFTDLYPALAEASPDDSTLFLKEIHYIDENEWYLPSSVDGVFSTYDAGVSYTMFDGIGGGAGFYKLDTSTYIVLGSSTKSKVSWNKGANWTDCYPGSSIWGIAGVLNDSLIGMAKTYLYKIALSDFAMPNSETDILTFALDEQTSDAVINTTDYTISIGVDTNQTDVSSLKPVLTLSAGATITPDTSVAQDFADTVTYTVTAENGYTAQDWEVIITHYLVSTPDITVSNITLYPNPARNRIYLSNLGETERIVIISIIGKVVLDLNSDDNNMEIDISTLEKGIYFISFYDIDGKVSTKKIIKE